MTFELLNQSREYIMELLKPVYQVFSDKKVNGKGLCASYI